MFDIDNLISKLEYFLYTRPRLARLDARLGALYRFLFRAGPPLSGHRKKGERTRTRMRMSGVRFQYLAQALKHRRRSLSLDALQPRNWVSRFCPSVPTQVHFQSQSQSRLCSLPPEIRIMIFELALCDTERIHVDFTDVAVESERLMHVTSWPCFHADNTKECHFGCLNVKEEAPRRRLALLQSCRLA
ncbi:hypothetical protein BCR34DRAFT_569671 [Clohesyomyces aquaticus]|uniref:DUF7730 domain-containing protein n=1 Tax=Clohesyomyces aquaticus TaxID=1231657 RepID=A0A1Y1ZEE4_9PLEO|nr:hypothetical protein BCR34DRAFT_569671 [Clohesyomyces aquaticus]